MTPVRGIRAGGALALLMLVPQLAPAAWDNVFQVTCFGRRSTSNYTACAPPCTSCAPACPCPAPCPAPCPQTAFVQRSYYQPVTTYQAVTSYEPVVSQRTSFFWEPVTTMSVSSFFDPCTCQCQQVATPVTSFRLRSQCNSVTNYVARVSYKPVTTMRQSCYWEQVAVPSCPPPCPTAAAAAPCPTCPSSGSGAVAAVPGTNPPPLNLPSDATLGEQRSNPPATLGETRDQYYMPHTQSLRPGAPVAPAPAPAYKPERVASRLGDSSLVSGTIVRSNYAPRSGARVVFVNSQRQSDRQSTTADAAGRFQVNLASGQWWVYVDNGSGQMTYHNQFNHQGNAGPLTVVSR